MPITTDEKKYLKNKHRGGVNNNEGAKYERSFATYCIALLINEISSNLSTTYVTSQVENSFVDDFLIRTSEDKKIYYQLKNVKKLDWSTKNLEYDFRRQMEISSEIGEKFMLKLVNSNRNNLEKLNDKPKRISHCTEIIFFPASESYNQLLYICPDFKNAIRNITVGDDAKDDELFGVVMAISAVWDNSTQNDVSIREILDKVCNTYKYIKIKSYQHISIRKECQEILQKFNVDYYVNGEILYWSFSSANGVFNGQVVWTDGLEKYLLENTPSDISELVTIFVEHLE